MEKMILKLKKNDIQKNEKYVTVLEDYPCWKNAQVLKFENLPYHVVLNFWGTE